MTRDEALNAVDSVHFLKHFLSQTHRKLLVIWDGSRIHRNEEVKSFLSEAAARQIHLERLPAYAPDLNPDEGVCKHLKPVELRNTGCLDLNDVHHKLSLAVLRLRRRPFLIQSFFDPAGLKL
jgi:transposase